MTKLFVGSTSECRYGVGNLFIGTEVKRSKSGYELLVNGEWIEVYDIMVVQSAESPMESDLTK